MSFSDSLWKARAQAGPYGDACVRRVFHWLAAAVFGALMLQAPAAAEIAARVNFTSGVVTATASGSASRPLQKGADIFGGDTIDTAENGRAQMRFTDGGLVSLMPNTTFSVDEYQHQDQAQEDGSLVFGMVRGGLRTITGSIGKVRHERYQLKTSVATLGIRGTEYIAVLNPPNTLRVHVGKGKVVITNDQGTLEVPEGRNAEVTLGTAPRFTEQGPLYLATAVGGDKAETLRLIDQDPYGLDVTQDLPLSHTLVAGAAIGPAGSTPPPSGPPSPPTPSPFLPDGLGYRLAGFTAGPAYYLSTDPNDFGVQFDPSSGAVTSVSGLLEYDIGSLQVEPSTLGTLGHVSWGEFTDGSGTLNGLPTVPSTPNVTLGQGQYLPYIIGSVAAQIPLGGILSYQLAGGSAARGLNMMSGQVGTLDAFNLQIDLSSTPTYGFDMQVSMPGVVYNAMTPSGTPLSSFSHTTGAFDFTAASVTGTQCTTVGCTANVDGFLAGPNAEQAGVSYHISSPNGEEVIGTAGLTQ
ncbi:FecR family protein [Castellaniella sp. GW247-6E4]|uniref:FecR family protein n=1 Tax=Castellaniella sp. GW247-6E4 TaxID=3140380 RepID=UPI003315C772